MPLSNGVRIGSYEVVDLLGSGGMREVYRARDLKLKRDVALKVLPEGLSHDGERIARLRREAQVLASLNHPNIAAIYGLEESGDTTALVMEVIESDTLSGPLGVETALNYARQIADALEAAHEKGIIHRDLKPGNIKVTSAGVVKVLDFGLATIAQPGGDTNDGVDPQNSPTLTRTLGTQAGLIMGTPAYMSPEQAAGKAVDKRTDIWSYGVVLFEMLTGRRLFEGGETISYTLADVLRAPIDLSKLPASTPAAIRDLLSRCLDRNVKNRLRDIGEARVAIDKVRTTPEVPATAPAARLSSTAWITAAIAMVIVAVIAGLGWWRATRQTERPLMRFTDDLGSEIDLSSNNGPAIAISRDGLRLAYVSRGSDGKTHLSLRLIGISKSTILAGAEGSSAYAPFFSPDGQWIGFFSETKLKKISVEGGAAVTLCEVGPAPRGGFWGEDGNILFADQRSPIMRVSAAGGTPSPITELDKEKGEVTNRFAQLLPGGEALLFTASAENNRWEDATIQVQTINSRQRKTLVTGGYFGRYVSVGSGAGYLTYVHEGTIFAAPMDLKRLELTGSASPVLEDVSGRAQNGFPQLDLTSSGTLVYVAGAIQLGLSLAFVDASGNAQILPAASAAYGAPPRPSPDGMHIAVRITDGSGTNLSVYEWATNRMTRRTFIKGAVVQYPTWTPDGKGRASTGCVLTAQVSRNACWRLPTKQIPFPRMESAWRFQTP